MGIRLLRNGYTPIPYTLHNDFAKRIIYGNKAEGAATFLANTIWGSPIVHPLPPLPAQPPLRQIIIEDLDIDTDLITMLEFNIAVNKYAEDAHPGPTQYPWNSSNK